MWEIGNQLLEHLSQSTTVIPNLSYANPEEVGTRTFMSMKKNNMNFGKMQGDNSVKQDIRQKCLN